MKNTLIKILTALSRHHLTALLAVTLADIGLIFMEEDVTVCFSVLLPQLTLSYGISQALLTGVGAIRAAGMAMSAICLALYVICLVMSYKKPGWMLCAAVMTALDAGIAVALLIMLNEPSYFVDLAVHIWIIAVLVAGFFLMRHTEKRRNAVEAPLPAEAGAAPDLPESAAENLSASAPADKA